MTSAMEIPSNIRNNFGNAYSSGDGLTLQAGVISGTVNIDRTPRKVLFPKVVYDATFDAANKEHVPSCLPGTRVEVLREIQQWIDGDNPKRLYWLNGMAGTGKSTIALTLARTYKRAEKETRLGGTFFFSRGGGDLASAGRVAATMASQLADVSPNLRKLIENAIESTSRLESLSVRMQWEKLIIEPLSELYGNYTQDYTPLLLIVDALDECNDAKDVKILIECLEALTSIESTRCRVFMTSRPDQPIQAGLRSSSSPSREKFVLHDIARTIVDQDLSLYYRDQLTDIKVMMRLDDNLFSENTIDRLVERSQGLFIHAATVCRFVRDGSYLAIERLQRLLNSEKSATAEQELDKMYTTILEYSFLPETHRLDPVETKSVCQLFRRIVGAIVITFDVMSSQDLALLLGETAQKIRATLNALHSVIDVPDDHQRPIRILHPSFRDFLLNPERCVVGLYAITAQETHEVLATRCFEILLSQLRRNPLNLEMPGVKVRNIPVGMVNECITMILQYSSRYWVEHTIRSGVSFRFDSLVLKFMQEKYLLWLECLAWMGQLEQGIEAMSLLNIFLTEQLSKQNSSISVPLKNKNPAKSATQVYVEDALQFLLSYEMIIAQTPLQAYLSALIFSPLKSQIRIQNRKHLPKWVANLPSTSEGWSKSADSILVSLPSKVHSVAVSSDSRLIAIACRDSQVHIKRAMTGKDKLILKGNHGGYSSVVFSPSGDYVASISSQGLSIWHIEAPSPNAKPPEFQLQFGNQYRGGQSERTRPRYMPTCAFSPDGNLLAGSSFSQGISVWNVNREISVKFRFDSSIPVEQLFFSSDGGLLISVSQLTQSDLIGPTYKSINVWDLETGQKLGKDVKISDDGFIFSVSGTEYIALSREDLTGPPEYVSRDARTGQDHRSPLTPKIIPKIAVFKPDGETVFGDFFPAMLVLWSGRYERRQDFESNTFEIRDAVFSPDGNLVVTFGSNFVQLLTIKPFNRGMPSASRWIQFISRLFKHRPTHIGRSHGQSVCVPSPDGSLFAIGWPGSPITIWEPKTGKQRLSIKVFGDRRSLRFSSNSRFCITRNNKKTRVWNLENGSKMGMLNGGASMDGLHVELEFSPSSNRVIQMEDFSRYSNQCRVLDIEGNKLVSKIPLPNGHVGCRSIALSPNDELYCTCGRDSGFEFVMEIRKLSDHEIQYRKIMDENLAVLDFQFMPDNQSMLLRVTENIHGPSPSGNAAYAWNPIQNQFIRITSLYNSRHDPLDGDWHRQLSLSHDGKVLAVANDKIIYLYDMPSATFLRSFEPQFDLQNIKFRPLFEKILITDRGTISLDESPLPSGWHLSVTKTWIQENGDNIVAIPAAYRDWKVFVNGHSVAFVKEGHDPLFLNFDEGMKGMECD